MPKPIRMSRKRPAIRGGALPAASLSVLRGLGSLIRAEPNIGRGASAELSMVAKRSVNSYNQGRVKAGQRPIDFPGRRRLPKAGRPGTRKYD